MMVAGESAPRQWHSGKAQPFSAFDAKAEVLGLLDSAGAPAGAGFDTVVVEEGDSLWSIAQSVSGGQDTRDVVLDIVEVNGLDRQVVHPGQELAVPGR